LDDLAEVAVVESKANDKAGTVTGQSTARRAAKLLVASDSRYVEPTRQERDAMLVGFAMHRKVLYGAAFDLVKLDADIDLSDPEAIAANIDAIQVIEVKSTNQERIGDDLKGYFFDLTNAELLVAQKLGEQFKFVFVNIISERWQEMSINEVFGRAKAIYPSMHIRF
jgi:hypothetical protein